MAPADEIRHVLLDADGVMQSLPGGWVAALRPYLGERAEEFLRPFSDDLACIRGEDDLFPFLAQRLADFGVTEDPHLVFRTVWLRIEVDPRSVTLVRRLRAGGLGVHLATNQEAGRAAYMLEDLEMAELFDHCFVSASMGLAKPDPAFFATAVRALGATAGSVLFVDDHLPNVAGARQAGLAAECWQLADGHPALATRLAAYGIDAGDFPP